MSYENRKKEYDRLIRLHREKDIPQNLLDEFGPAEKPATISSKKKGKK